MKLNLGCGNRSRSKSEGWVNIDIDYSCNPDMVLASLRLRIGDFL